MGETIRQPKVALRVKVFAGRPEAVSAEVNSLVESLTEQSRWLEGRVEVVPVGDTAVATLQYAEVEAWEVIDPRTGKIIRTETPQGLQVLEA